MQQELPTVAIGEALERQFFSGAECRKERRLIDVSHSAGIGCHKNVPVSTVILVKQSRPLVAGKVQVQSLERSETTNGDGDLARHASQDSRVEKDAPAGHRADVDQLGPFIASPAPTEPQVTNVTSASTARIAIGDDERIAVGMLVEPPPRPLVEYDGEVVHHEIMALPAWLGRRDVLVVAE